MNQFVNIIILYLAVLIVTFVIGCEIDDLLQKRRAKKRDPRLGRF